MYTDSPFAPIVKHWLQKIELAWQYKKKVFQDDADEGTRFYCGPYDFMYDTTYRARSRGFVFAGDSEVPSPAFRMTVNKVAELVQIYGPVLYHRNPTRQVNPRRAPDLTEVLAPMLGLDPMMGQMLQQTALMAQFQSTQDAGRAAIFDAYLNATPNLLDLKSESRKAIDEALIKGMGCLWQELYQPPGAPFKMAGSFYDTVDNLVIDPDMESLRDAKWIARRYIQPTWQVEAMYGLAPGTLQSSMMSAESAAHMAVDPAGMHRKKEGRTNDLVAYWRIYSKMGFGTLMSGVAKDFQGQLELFGPYCHLVVCADTDYFLNLPPQLTASIAPEQALQFVQWPTPFWADDAWPFTPIYFHETPREVWPMSHIKPAMGELKFLNWVYSFVAGKIRTACRDIIAVTKGVGEEIKRVILRGTDYELMEIERAHGTISEIVQFLQHPQFHGDIWKVLELIEHNFEKRTGLSELMYGSSPVQMRSASEAQVKSDNLKVRPDDMANKVEDAMSSVGKSELILARWHLQPQDIQPILGDAAAIWWQQLVMMTDPAQAIHALDCRIEAGSAKKPNQERDAQNMQQAMQTLFQPLWQYAMATGNVAPVNALLENWAKTINLDVAKFLLPVPPPPPPAGQEPQAGPGMPPTPRQQVQNQRKAA